ncbi:hypothetical protein [Dendronalium sp. ChiSLP03b]|nr:hypothetical protein [Dendronalium sp. ChiSLP03b]MDZ8208924.1 hypothetical protein [Dendronalium sp. ChiSLP03b]
MKTKELNKKEFKSQEPEFRIYLSATGDECLGLSPSPNQRFGGASRWRV